MDNNKLSSRFLKQNSEQNFSNKLNKLNENNIFGIEEVPNNKIEEDFRKALLEKIDTIPVWFEYSQNRQKELIKNFVEARIASEDIKLEEIDKDILIDNLLSSITNFGAIQELLDKENVQAVIVNGTKSIHIEIDGRILNTESCLNEKQLKFLISSISNMSGIEKFKGINQFAIKNYSISFVSNDICLNGPNITIRKKSVFTPEYLIKKGMFTSEIYEFLISAIDMKKNIVISGGINSGKTTLIDAIISKPLKNKRTFILENNPQINFDSNSVVKFKNNDGIISYIAKSSPEYLVCDLNYIEPEFIDMNGFITTIRANSTDSAIQVLIGMCVVGGLPAKFAKSKALKNFDYIIQLEKFEDGISRISSIVELTPSKTMQASIKTIAKYADGEFITQIPQPFTSMRAKTILV